MGEKVFSESLAVKTQKDQLTVHTAGNRGVKALAQAASTQVLSLFSMKDHK
jgi:D-tyrosyl-tRNA(Tyr) deacylase